LQGIIVVGDVNVDEMEKQIKDLFSPIKLDENSAERIYYPVPDNKEPIVALATDPEARTAQVMVFFKHDPIPTELKNTQAGFITQYVMNVASAMLNQRFREITQSRTLLLLLLTLMTAITLWPKPKMPGLKSQEAPKTKSTWHWAL